MRAASIACQRKSSAFLVKRDPSLGCIWWHMWYVTYLPPSLFFAPKLQSVKLLGVFPIVQVVLFVQTLLCFIFFPRCLIIAHLPHPQTTLRSVTSGTSATSRKTTTKKIGFYFFTYEWSRRRLSLIKMINGVEEALILLFAAFRYEYLFWSDVVRAWKVRIFIR